VCTRNRRTLSNFACTTVVDATALAKYSTVPIHKDSVVTPIFPHNNTQRFATTAESALPTLRQPFGASASVLIEGDCRADMAGKRQA
jgi:hypothetical protein